MGVDLTDKVQLKVYLPKKLVENLWILIKKKYSKPYGALSAEVQNAIAHWLNEHEETLDLHTNTHKVLNPNFPRSHLLAKQIIDTLRDKGFIDQCSIKDLKKVIINLRGFDPRTVKKWINFLVDNGYLKWLTHRTLEIL